jgi:shikimate kinase
MIKKINRIIIWGGCGHGKTILGKQISKILNIPNYDLDKVTFNKNFTTKVSDFLRDKRLKNIITKQKWIIEGAYAGEWIYPAIKKSNLVIILKINPFIATKRVIFRFIKRKIRKTEDRGGPLTDLPRIMKYAYGYTSDYYPKHIVLANKFNKNCIILKNKNQINNFLNNLK